MTYHWCHGPQCHTKETQSRVRGSKGNKVLRTIKIKENKWNQDHAFKYFCNQNCLFGFISHYLNEMVNINPVRKPSETPVKVTTHTYDMGYREGQTYKTIEVLNE